jgi:ATP-binding cassette subfamily B protein
MKKKKEHHKKQIISDNLYLTGLCFKAAPLCMTLKLFDSARAQVFTFIEWVWGMNYILESVELQRPFADVRNVIIDLFLFLVSGMLISLICTYAERRDMPKLRKEIKLMLYKKAGSVDMAQYDQPEFYNELAFILKEADNQIDRCLTFWQEIIKGIFAATTIGAFFMMKDKLSMLFVILALLATLLANHTYVNLSYQSKLDKNPYERKRDYVKRVFYLQNYAKEIRVHKEVTDELLADFEKASEKIYDIEKSYARKRFFTGTLLSGGLDNIVRFVLYLPYLLYKAMVLHTLSLSNVVIMINSFDNIWYNLRRLTEVYPYAAETSLYVQRIRTFLDYENNIQSKENLSLDKEVKSLDIKNVTFGYTKDNIINDLSLSVKKGEKLAIVGYNGAGKTTLVKLLMRLYDPDSGSIEYNGVDIKRYDVNEYRHNIGVVFQDYKLFAGSVMDNLRLDVLREEKSHQVSAYDALQKCGLRERVELMPSGLLTQLTSEFYENGVNLSGGEEQKLAIGRVYYRDNHLIIMDEPSSALDPIAEYQINKLMLENNEDKTIIFISHRLSTTRFADRIIYLKDGQIAERGTHKELLAQNGEYADMWKVQASQYAG